ncbi:unnamed protein product [Effrenium voratum]|nr:unnamed protein product [Effrenium voratum]CAJ1438485.1 unnamed protein product [Effrenium voratum]
MMWHVASPSQNIIVVGPQGHNPMMGGSVWKQLAIFHQAQAIRMLQTQLLPALEGDKAACRHVRDLLTITLWADRPNLIELTLQFKDKQKVLRLKGTDVQNSQVFGGMPKALRRLLSEDAHQVLHIADKVGAHHSAIKLYMQHMRLACVHLLQAVQELSGSRQSVHEVHDLCDKIARLSLILRPKAVQAAERKAPRSLKQFFLECGGSPETVGRVLTHFSTHLHQSKTSLRRALEAPVQRTSTRPRLLEPEVKPDFQMGVKNTFIHIDEPKVTLRRSQSAPDLPQA